MKYLVIKVDTNDADYLTANIKVTDKQLKLLQPLIKAIKGFKPYFTKSNSGTPWKHNSNWPTGEYGCREDLGEKTTEELYVDTGLCTQEAHDLMVELVPTGENRSV